MIFWLIFLDHIPRKTTYGRRPKKNILQTKNKNIFVFVFWRKKKKDFLVEIFFVIFRGRRPMEDNLTNNLTSLMLVLAQYNFYFYSSKL